MEFLKNVEKNGSKVSLICDEFVIDGEFTLNATVSIKFYCLYHSEPHFLI